MSESILLKSSLLTCPRLADKRRRCNSRAVITITNLNPEDKARGPYRKGGNELLEAPFPQAAREFAEKTIDQSRESLRALQQNPRSCRADFAKSFDAAGQGAAALRRQIIVTAQRNLNLSFDLAKSLAGASNLSEIVDLQAAYWRKQFDAFTTQADEVGNRLFELGQAQGSRDLA